jgi:hypothetical protein
MSYPPPLLHQITDPLSNALYEVHACGIFAWTLPRCARTVVVELDPADPTDDDDSTSLLSSASETEPAL